MSDATAPSVLAYRDLHACADHAERVRAASESKKQTAEAEAVLAEREYLRKAVQLRQAYVKLQAVEGNARTLSMHAIARIEDGDAPDAAQRAEYCAVVRDLLRARAHADDERARGTA